MSTFNKRWHTNICIHCDITMYNGESRHILSIRQLLSTWVITFDNVKSNDNNADPLIEALIREWVSKLCGGMELKPRKSLYEGKPNPADWRSQDLGSIGQPNRINRGRSLWGSNQFSIYLRELVNFLVHSYKSDNMRISLSLLMIQLESPMWERSGVASKGNVWGAIPKSSRRTRLVFMTITNTTMRIWLC
jgi:hypothetical protein